MATSYRFKSDRRHHIVGTSYARSDFFWKNQSPAPLFLLFRKKPRLRSQRKNIRSFLARFFPFRLPTTFSRLLRRIFPIRDYFNLTRLLHIAIGFTAVTLLEEIEREFLALSFILFYKKSYLLYLHTCLPAAHGGFMRYCYFLQTVPLRWDLLQFWRLILVRFFTSRGALRPLSHLIFQVGFL